MQLEQAIIQGLGVMAKAQNYPKEIDAELILIWNRILSKVKCSPETFLEACEEWMSQSPDFPAPKNILDLLSSKPVIEHYHQPFKELPMPEEDPTITKAARDRFLSRLNQLYGQFGRVRT